LPADAKPVVSWRSRDRAWANVADGLRERIVSLTTTESRPLEGSAVMLARSLGTRKKRVDEIVERGEQSAAVEAKNLFTEIVRIAKDIGRNVKELAVKTQAGENFCRVIAADVELFLFAKPHPVPTRSRLYAKIVTEDDRADNWAMMPTHSEHRFGIADDGGPGWVSGRDEFIESKDLADQLLVDLLQRVDLVERRRM
jgi:hypothetical protein